VVLSHRRSHNKTGPLTFRKKGRKGWTDSSSGKRREKRKIKRETYDVKPRLRPGRRSQDLGRKNSPPARRKEESDAGKRRVNSSYRDRVVLREKHRVRSRQDNCWTLHQRKWKRKNSPVRRRERRIGARRVTKGGATHIPSCGHLGEKRERECNHAACGHLLRHRQKRKRSNATCATLTASRDTAKKRR